MAGQALRITGKDACGMRRCMALCALRLIFVPCKVTKSAIDRFMLACRILQFAVNLSVACAAGCRRSIIRIGYLQRSVDRMTLGAGIFSLTFNMRLVAIKTGWDQPMGRMT